MTWQKEVEVRIRLLPQEFTLADVYRFIPALHQAYPQNQHMEEKIRQTLQELRDGGKIGFLDTRGHYRNFIANDDRIADQLPFPNGHYLRRADLAQLIEMKDETALERGMFSPAKGPFQNHIFLFHDEKKNPYKDVVEPGRIKYVGQGKRGDQKLNSFNGYLANHLELGLHAQYFTQPRDRPGEIRYDGEVVLENYTPAYRAEEDRSVYEFTLVPLDSPVARPLNEFGMQYENILDDEREPGFEERPRQETLVRRVIRQRAFHDHIRLYYRRECAICGKAFERGNLVDVQAAHIVPVAEGGRDDRRNGIALCARHHWAFDNAFFSLDDEYKVIWFGPGRDPHGELEHGKTINLPEPPFPRPHSLYLRYHRSRSKRISLTE